MPNQYAKVLPTSAPCRTPTISTSSSEFLHPTIVAGIATLGAAEGQNTLINPC